MRIVDATNESEEYINDLIDNYHKKLKEWSNNQNWKDSTPDSVDWSSQPILDKIIVKNCLYIEISNHLKERCCWIFHRKKEKVKIKRNIGYLEFVNMEEAYKRIELLDYCIDNDKDYSRLYLHKRKESVVTLIKEMEANKENDIKMFSKKAITVNPITDSVAVINIFGIKITIENQ